MAKGRKRAKRDRGRRSAQHCGRVTPKAAGPVRQVAPVLLDLLDAPLAAALEEARPLLGAEDPLEVELFASMVASTWRPRPWMEANLAEGAPVLIDALAGAGRPEALLVLRGLGAVATELLAIRARRAAEEVVRGGLSGPPWLGEVGTAEVAECWVMTDVLGDAEGLVLGCRYPSGRAHSVLVLIDHTMGTLVKDAFALPLSVSDTVAHLAGIGDGDGGTTFEPLDPASAAARIRQALELNDITFPPIETDTFPAVRPLLDARLATMPRGGEIPTAPELDEDARAGLVDDFLHHEGAALATDEDAAEIAHQLVHYRCDYGDGDPLRWSPGVVEILLMSWWPRKVAGPVTFHARVPDVVRAWVRYAGRRRDLATVHVEVTLRAIDAFEAEFEELVDDPDAWGPAKALVHEMMASGVDLADPGAVTAYVDDVNVGLVPPAGGPDPFDWTGVPMALRDRVAEIVERCDAACEALLDVEYRTLARRVVEKLARKRPSPLDRGRVEIWAGGVLHALGQANYLFYKSARPHVTIAELASAVGANASSIAQKSTMVRDAVRLRDGDPEFTRGDLLALGPMRLLARYGLGYQ